MPPKRVQRPPSTSSTSTSSSSSSSSDDDAPMETSFSSLKQQALSEQSTNKAFLQQREQERLTKIKQQQEQQRIVQEKKRQKTLREAKKLQAQNDRDDDEDDTTVGYNQRVQLSTEVTSHKLATYDDDGDDFDADALLAAAKKQKDLKAKEEAFILQKSHRDKKDAQRELQERLKQQQMIAKLIENENEPSEKLITKSRRVGQFQINIQKTTTTSGRASAFDLLAEAHSFTPGAKVQYAEVQLQAAPRIHASTDRRFASKSGVSHSILDRGLTAQAKVKKSAKRR